VLYQYLTLRTVPHDYPLIHFALVPPLMEMDSLVHLAHPTSSHDDRQQFLEVGLKYPKKQNDPSQSSRED
jgi:hypothetical protein